MDSPFTILLLSSLNTGSGVIFLLVSFILSRMETGRVKRCTA